MIILYMIILFQWSINMATIIKTLKKNKKLDFLETSLPNWTSRFCLSLSLGDPPTLLGLVLMQQRTLRFFLTGSLSEMASSMVAS